MTRSGGSNGLDQHLPPLARAAEEMDRPREDDVLEFRQLTLLEEDRSRSDTMEHGVVQQRLPDFG